MTADLHDDDVIGPGHQLPESETTRAGRQLPPSDPASPPRRRHHIILWGLLLLGLLIAALLLFRHHHEEVEKAAAAHLPHPGIPITTATAKKGNIGVYLDAIGTVTPVYTDSITSEVNGLIVAVHYQEGQRVSKGDPLIDIDSRPYRANLLQAEGVLERDQNLLAQAQMDLDRYRAAWARNAIAKQQFDDQEKLVRQDEGTVKNDEGTVQYDQVQVDFCHITAPIAGRMGLRLVGTGQRGAVEWRRNPRRHYADRAHHGYFHHTGRQPGPGDEPP